MIQNSFLYNINKICAFFLIVWVCWPWFTQNAGLMVGMALSVGWCGTAIMMNRKYVMGTDGLMMMCYVVIMASSYILTRKTYGEYELLYFVAMAALFFLPYYMCKFYVGNDDKKFMGLLAIVAIIFMIPGCYTSIKYTEIDPNIMKTISQAKDMEFIEYRKAGIGSFGFIYMLLFVIIAVVGLLKSRKLNTGLLTKILLICFCVIGVYCLLKSTFTTSLILVTVGVILVLVTQKRSVSNNIIIYILLLVGTFLAVGLIGNMLINVNFESADVDIRMHEIGNLLLGNESGENVSGRLEYLEKSINCFLEYPILGYNFAISPTVELGGHCEWIDMFAVYGIIGGIPLLTTIIIKLKNTAKIVKEHIDFPFYSVILFIFVIFGFIDPFLRLYNTGFAMFLIIPCIGCIPNALEKKVVKDENTLGY